MARAGWGGSEMNRMHDGGCGRGRKCRSWRFFLAGRLAGGGGGGRGGGGKGPGFGEAASGGGCRRRCRSRCRSSFGKAGQGRAGPWRPSEAPRRGPSWLDRRCLLAWRIIALTASARSRGPSQQIKLDGTIQSPGLLLHSQILYNCRPCPSLATDAAWRWAARGGSTWGSWPRPLRPQSNVHSHARLHAPIRKQRTHIHPQIQLGTDSMCIRRWP